jgi:hypothetical protein
MNWKEQFNNDSKFEHSEECQTIRYETEGDSKDCHCNHRHVEAFIKEIIEKLIEDIALDDVEEVRKAYSITPSFIHGYESAVSDLRISKQQLKSKWLSND